MEELYLELNITINELRSVTPDKMSLLLLTAISSGTTSTDNVKTSGPEETETVYCWGSNSSQQLTDSVSVRNICVKEF